MTSTQYRKAELSTPWVKDPLTYMHLEDFFSPEQNQTRKILRSFLKKEVIPAVSENSETKHFPKETLSKLARLNIFGLLRPQYGCRQITSMEKALIFYELSRADLSFASFYLTTQCLVIPSIEQMGSRVQQSKYLPRLCRLEITMAWGFTEPNSGSDGTSLETTATPTAAGFLISGAKKWISHSPFADYIIVYARNTQNHQIQAFIVNTQSEGISISQIERKLGFRSGETGLVNMKEVFVPAGDRLERARGFGTGVGAVLSGSRVFVAWMCAGAMATIYEQSCAYLRTRVQFKSPLAGFQLSQEKLVRILSSFQTCFLQAWRLTKLMESGRVFEGQASLVKAWCTSTARNAAALGRELLGGNGILLDFQIMRMMMDLEVLYTFEGTYDINSLIAGKAISGIAGFKPAFKL